MKGYRKILDTFIIVFYPIFWGMNDPYDAYWDKQFNQTLDEYHFTEIGDYTAKLGPYEIWISNYPYSCYGIYTFDQYMAIGTPISYGSEEYLNMIKSHRPSRYTILRAHRKLKKDLIRQNMTPAEIRDKTLKTLGI